jgi:hypothetical protein
MLPIPGEETLVKSVADSGHSCQTQRFDRKESRNRTSGRLPANRVLIRLFTGRKFRGSDN